MTIRGKTSESRFLLVLRGMMRMLGTVEYCENVAPNA